MTPKRALAGMPAKARWYGAYLYVPSFARMRMAEAHSSEPADVLEHCRKLARRPRLGSAQLCRLWLIPLASVRPELHIKGHEGWCRA
jgi:hypothetical protein